MPVMTRETCTNDDNCVVPLMDCDIFFTSRGREHRFRHDNGATSSQLRADER